MGDGSFLHISYSDFHFTGVEIVQLFTVKALWSLFQLRQLFSARWLLRCFVYLFVVETLKQQAPSGSILMTS